MSKTLHLSLPLVQYSVIFLFICLHISSFKKLWNIKHCSYWCKLWYLLIQTPCPHPRPLPLPLSKAHAKHTFHGSGRWSLTSVAHVWIARKSAWCVNGFGHRGGHSLTEWTFTQQINQHYEMYWYSLTGT